MPPMFKHLAVVTIILASAAAVVRTQSGGLTPAAKEWSAVSGDLGNTRYSALTQINRDTLSKLKGAWNSAKFDDGGGGRAMPVVKDGMLFMTATVAAKLDTERPESTAITFILSNDRLITNRYIDTRPFRNFVSYAERHPAACNSPVVILAGLMESITERIADTLERVGNDLEAVSGSIFQIGQNKHKAKRDLRGLLERIGFNGELNSKARESLVSVARILVFLQQSTMVQMNDEQRSRFRSIATDVAALSDHSSFLGSKVSFLLEATLGLINLEQNNIIKIFSVAAVMFMPPTLIASVYGMNFMHMPELKWMFGYPFALSLMFGSILGIYIYFKRRGWL